MPGNRYTSEQIEWLRAEYRRLSVAELTLAFNQQFAESRSEGAIRGALRNRKITSGRTGHFESGKAPWSAGTKGVLKRNSGSFSKGHVPSNERPLGSERICRDGQVWVKVAEVNPYTGAPTRFRQKHILVYERAHGPVPEGQVLTFLDGDRQNCELSNLVPISRRVLAVLNKKMGFGKATDPDVRQALINLATIEVMANDRARESEKRGVAAEKSRAGL